MTARFPLFRFPPNVAEILLKDLELVDLFELSQLSKRAFNLARSTALLYKGNASLLIKLGSSCSVTLFRGLGDIVFWKFYGSRDQNRYELVNFKQQIVTIYGFNAIFARKTTYEYACASDSIEDVLLLILYLVDLFNAKIRHFSVENSQFRKIEMFQSLSSLRKGENVIIKHGTVSHEEMRRILSGFECNQMRIECSPEPNFHYDLPMCAEHLVVHNGRWFKAPMLLNLNCRNFMILDCELTDEDINSFINQWVAFGENLGKFRVFQYLQRQYHTTMGYGQDFSRP